MSPSARSRDNRASIPAMFCVMPSKKFVLVARNSASRIALSISAGP